MDSKMLFTFLASLAGHTLLFLYIFKAKIAIENLKNEVHYIKD
jgi:hypothetical protein